MWRGFIHIKLSMCKMVLTPPPHKRIYLLFAAVCWPKHGHVLTNFEWHLCLGAQLLQTKVLLWPFCMNLSDKSKFTCSILKRENKKSFNSYMHGTSLKKDGRTPSVLWTQLLWNLFPFKSLTTNRQLVSKGKNKNFYCVEAKV